MTLMEMLNAVNTRTVEINSGLAKLNDETALAAPELFAVWASGTEYVAEQRIRYGGKLYRCVQPHTAQEGWEPDKTPALWTEVALPGEIPVWKQPTGAHDAYNKGDRVWYPAKFTTVYVSLIDANVYSPEAYPAGWEVVE